MTKNRRPSRMPSWRSMTALFAVAVSAGAVAASCGGSGDSSGSTGPSSGGAGSTTSTASAQGGSGGGSLISSSTGQMKISTDYPCAGCNPFPPIGTMECDPMVLPPATIAYPLDGILFPPNMNVLEVQFVPPPKATLFEVDFENAVTDVKVETMCNAVPDVRGGMSRGCGVTLPQMAWDDISNANRDGDPLKITVRSTIDGKCVATSVTKVEVSFAKDDLSGGIYYWQSAVFGGIGGKTGGIYSHDFGTFDPVPTPFYTSGGTGTCVGCHNVSRDGERMALGTDDPDADDEFADVKSHVLDVPSRAAIGGGAMSPGFQTFTHDHKLMIASTYKDSKNLAFDLFDGDGKALIKKLSLPMGMAATQPDLAKDDASLVFVVPAANSISSRGDHHFMGGALYSASFDTMAQTMGAPVAMLTPTGNRTFYYPSIAPTLKFVVFNDAPQDDAFYNRNARVKLIHYPPAVGAMPIDLPKLNVKDGITNSWPRWSPFVGTFKGKKILWVTFSSNRDYGLHLVNENDPKNPGKPYDNCYPPESPAYDQPQPLSKQGVGYENCASPQIWMAAIVVDEDPKLDAGDRSYPAFWLPFQDVNSHNHSAQWVEKIPVINLDGGSGDGGGCGMAGASCAQGQPCCDNVVCCNGTCTDFSNCIN